MDKNPTIFTEKAEAERQAHGRLLALRASPAIVGQAADGKAVMEARRIAVLDRTGTLSRASRSRSCPPGAQGGLSSTA